MNGTGVKQHMSVLANPSYPTVYGVLAIFFCIFTHTHKHTQTHTQKYTHAHPLSHTNIHTYTNTHTNSLSLTLEMNVLKYIETIHEPSDWNAEYEAYSLSSKLNVAAPCAFIST